MKTTSRCQTSWKHTENAMYSFINAPKSSTSRELTEFGRRSWLPCATQLFSNHCRKSGCLDQKHKPQVGTEQRGSDDGARIIDTVGMIRR